ncbi:zinc-binding dehydrogenase [Agrobacterium vitis]|nr:zinc-binding dehydrogenase [Agrobacterium vitis]WEO75163.1 zinc-binding dehydrogenase [Agrobacterium vitis]
MCKESGEQLETLELLPLRPQEVVVRVQATNVGSADVLSIDAPPPPGTADKVADGASSVLPTLPRLPANIIHGHAAVGLVEHVGSAVGGVKVGDRVLVTSSANCGQCHFCRRGRMDQCAQNTMVSPPIACSDAGGEVHGNSYVGSFAELAVTRETQVTTIFSDLPLEQLALISNPVSTGVGAALVTAPIQAGSIVAVIGCGPVGLSYIMAARLAGASRIIAVEPLAQRRQAALRCGATDIIDPRETDPVAAVQELSGDAGGEMQGRGADYVFEAATDARAVEQAWAMARSAGHVVLAGIDIRPGAMVSFPAAPFALGGKVIHVCQQGSLIMRRDLPWLIRLAERGQLDLSSLAQRSYGLGETGQALRDVSNRAVLGATVLPGI